MTWFVLFGIFDLFVLVIYYFTWKQIYNVNTNKLEYDLSLLFIIWLFAISFWIGVFISQTNETVVFRINFDENLNPIREETELQDSWKMNYVYTGSLIYNTWNWFLIKKEWVKWIIFIPNEKIDALIIRKYN